jgi:outer membrane protein insertion porin family
MKIILLMICGAMSSVAQFASVETSEDPYGKRIKEVQVQIFGPTFGYTPASLVKNVASKPGDVFTVNQRNADIRALLSSGGVTNAECITTIQGLSVSLIYGVVCSGKVDEIKFSGNNVFGYEKLRRLIKIKEGRQTDGQRIEEGIAALHHYYAYAYYSDAQVEHELLPSAKEGFWNVVYRIEEGRRNFIKSVAFEGNKQIESKKLREIIKTKTRIDDNVINEDILAIGRIFQESGFAYAHVTEVRKVPISDTEISLCFVINEGDKYSVSTIQITGNTAFSEEELKPIILSESGVFYSGSQVSGDSQVIQDYYVSRGYADARVDVNLLGAGKGKVSLVFNITEGTKFYVNRINISGNNRTRDEVIRRELLIAPGEELNTNRLAVTEGVLKSTNWFSDVDIRTNPTENPNFRDIDITVTENSTGGTNLGLGYSSIEGIRFKIGTGNTNFSTLKPYSGGGIGVNLDLAVKQGSSELTLGVKSRLFLGGYLQLELPEPEESENLAD